MTGTTTGTLTRRSKASATSGVHDASGNSTVTLVPSAIPTGGSTLLLLMVAEMPTRCARRH